MPNGDPIKAGEQNSATTITTLFTDPFWDGSSPCCFIGPPTNNVGDLGGVDVTGLIGRASYSGYGLVGWGGERQGTGVLGAGGVEFLPQPGGGTTLFQTGGDGVAGVGGPGKAGYTTSEAPRPEVVPPIPAGTGVQGFGGAGASAADIPPNTTDGVAANPGVGVWGQGGVDGGTPLPGSGVVGSSSGLADSPFPFQQGNGVAGIGLTGVYGYGALFGVVGATRDGGGGVGVLGANLSYSPGANATGVKGIGAVGGKGVAGQVPFTNTSQGATAVAIYGEVTSYVQQPSGQGPWAGAFVGPVSVDGHLAIHSGDLTVNNGNFTVTGGNKSVAVPFADGSHRLLYCLESPECWFEDFGEAKLIDGKAEIELPHDFASVIDVDSYHVFLTPYGPSNGLYVSTRTRQGFVVEEQGHGKSSLSLSFRIVGKRKDGKAERFAEFAVFKGAKPPKLPALPDEFKVEVNVRTKPSLRTPSAALSAADRPIPGR